MDKYKYIYALAVVPAFLLRQLIGNTLKLKALSCTIGRNTFLQLGQKHFATLTNTLSYLDKYILQLSILPAQGPFPHASNILQLFSNISNNCLLICIFATNSKKGDVGYKHMLWLPFCSLRTQLHFVKKWMTADSLVHILWHWCHQKNLLSHS